MFIVLLARICFKLASCHSGVLTQATCESAILNEDDFDTEYGLNSADYSTYQEIINADSAAIITGDETSFSQCVSDITDLSCDDAEVLDAFDTNDPTNFTNAYKIIPVGAGSCNDLF